MERLRVLITGGNKGIGLELTRECLRKDCEVIIVARDFDAFEYKDDARVSCVEFDLRQTSKIPDLVRSLGRVDVLINNAGIMLSLPYDAYPQEKVDELLQINIKAPVALITEVSRGMVERGGGRVVNNASLAGYTGHPDVWYGISKAALLNATKSFAKMLGGKGVIVNAVAAGPVETEMLNTIPVERRNAVKSSVYTNRFAKADEVAKTMCWLAFDSPEYINGTCIDINNGAYPR